MWMNSIAKKMRLHHKANHGVGPTIHPPHLHHLDNNTVIDVKKQTIIKLLIDVPISVDTLHHHNVTMRMTMVLMTSWKVLALIGDPQGNVVIAMSNKLMRAMLLKVATTMTTKLKVVPALYIKSANKLMMSKLLKVATIMTMKTMSAINIITMNAKSVKEVSNVKLDYNVIINYILMTTAVISIMSKGATKALKIAMPLTWKMSLVSTTTDKMMITT